MNCCPAFHGKLIGLLHELISHFALRQCRVFMVRVCGMSTEITRNLHTELLQRIAHYSQVRIGEAANIEKTAMHRIVSGERGVTLEEMSAFFKALGMTV